MRSTLPLRCLHPVVLALSFLLAACGGGSSTAGTGGSGVGGTGITLVRGNVSQVVAESAPGNHAPSRRLLAAAARLLAAPVSAQSSMLGDIKVIGGGQETATDGNGNFTLENVTPSQNFILRFQLSGGQTIVLPIGNVPGGATVEVVNVLLNTGTGVASAGDVRVENDDDNSDDEGGGAGDGDGDSDDGDGEDGDSADNGVGDDGDGDSDDND